MGYVAKDTKQGIAYRLRAAHPDTDTERYCLMCAKYIPISNFSVRSRKSNKNELHSFCKSCNAFDQVNRRYGITKVQYDDMKISQNNKCAICSCEFIKTPHVDHCHKTNKIRGLLCGHCNTALGNFGDNKSILQSAIDYLKQHD